MYGNINTATKPPSELAWNVNPKVAFIPFTTNLIYSTTYKRIICRKFIPDFLPRATERRQRLPPPIITDPAHRHRPFVITRPQGSGGRGEFGTIVRKYIDQPSLADLIDARPHFIQMSIPRGDKGTEITRP